MQNWHFRFSPLKTINTIYCIQCGVNRRIKDERLKRPPRICETCFIIRMEELFSYVDDDGFGVDESEEK